MATAAEIRDLLSQGLDLCVRARKLDAQDRRENFLAASGDANAWQENGQFDRFITRHNIQDPDRPISTRSGTIPLWVQEQYEHDLADWEGRARKALSEPES